MENFLELGVWAKVGAYAIVPLVMGWMGNRLAAEAIPDVRRRRRYNAIFIVWVTIGVVGTWVVESQAEHGRKDELRTHRHEIEDSKKSLETFEGLLISRQKDSANLIAKLVANLDPDVLAKAFVTATSKGARKDGVSALGPTEPVLELKTQTREFVADLHRFANGYIHDVEAIGKRGWTADSTNVTADSTDADAGGGVSYLPTESSDRLTTEAGEPLIIENVTNAQLKLATAKRAEFNEKYLARAVALRDQLLARVSGAPQLKGFPPSRLLAFNGYLTAPSLVTDAADYLDALASLLPVPSPSR